MADDKDNCPDRANPNQADEEGDGLGDVCDPCPISTDNSDTDGDGVGDQCERRSGLPGEAFALFEGFADPQLPAGATNVGAWQFPGGVARLSVAAAGQKGGLLWTAPSTTYTISASITAEGNSDTDLEGAGLAVETRGSLDTGWHCGLGVALNQAVLQHQDVSNAATTATTPLTWQVGGSTMLLQSREAESANAFKTICASLDTGASLVRTNISSNPAANHTGVYISEFAVTVQWVMIVTSPDAN